ncbi:hypothetical protein D3C79_583210 [compost metagenome]
MCGRTGSGGAPQLLALSLSAFQACGGALYEQIALKLSYGTQHLHGHLACCAGEVYAPKGEAVHPDTSLCEALDGLAYVHGVPPQAVQLSDYEYVATLHALQQLLEARAVSSLCTTRYGFSDYALRLYCKASGPYLKNLVIGRLLCGTHSGVQEGAAHGESSVVSCNVVSL